MDIPMGARADFRRWFAGMSEKEQQAWIKRRMLIVHKKLEQLDLFSDARADAQDIVMTTLARLCLEPTGEYAPHDFDSTPQRYWWRCERVRVKAAIRERVREVRRTDRIIDDESSESRLSARGRLTVQENMLHQLRSALLEEPRTPEEVLIRKQLLVAALRLIENAVAQSRLSGTTKEYAQRIAEFYHFDEDGHFESDDTEKIAAKLRTTPAAIRTARLRVMRHLARQGVVDELMLRPPPTDTRH